MAVLQSVLGFLIVLGILVTLHELGHFLVAKAFRFPVEVFSIGLGPRAWGFRRRETDYRLSWVPLGGYVKVRGLGLDESDLIAREGDTPPASLAGPRWKRFLIFLGGPSTNLVVALLFVSASFLVGIQVPAILEKPVVVGFVDAEGPAARAGIRPGDRITAVEGRPLPDWQAFSETVLLSGGERAVFTVARGGETLDLPVQIEKKGKYRVGDIGVYPEVLPRIQQVNSGSPAEAAGLKAGDIIVSVDGKGLHHYAEVVETVRARPGAVLALEVQRGAERFSTAVTLATVEGKGQMGVLFSAEGEGTVLKRYGVAESFRRGVGACLDGATLSYRFLQKLLQGKGSIRQVSGPIDMARISGEFIRTGPANFLHLMGLISLQLAIFNLLPIPLLDGGHMFILAVEGLMRRDFKAAFKYRILQAGFAFLMTLFAVVLVFDILKLL
jgi:regulator of sigma E protease